MTLDNLHHIPGHAAKRDPQGIAYRFMDQELTFGELDHQVAQLVFVLQQQGVKPGDRVGICLRKSLETAIAGFAIMAAGGVYVPLDPTAPEARWAEILKSCGANHMISHPGLQPKLNKLFSILPALSHVIGAQGGAQGDAVTWEEVRCSPRGKIIARAPDDPAYIMFTSGSTGVPKGMVHTHASGLSYLQTAVALFEMQPSDRIALHSGLHFDMSLWPVFGAPLVGARCVIMPDAYTRLPAEMTKMIEREKLTLWYSVPFALNQMLEQGALDKRDTSSLRWIVYAGEPFAPDAMRALMGQMPQARFSNNYGPAEVNVVTYMHANTAQDVPDTGLPIGAAMPHTQACVLDHNDTPLPAGLEGELVFATPAMMRGYWADPDRTAQCFLNIEGVQFYRSGDMAVQDREGVFHLRGRKDRQIKVRGARLELDEVELVLNAHPDILEAAAMATTDGTEVTAAIVPKPGAQPDMAALRLFAATQLPSYGVPREIVKMAQFPRTGSGKLDRRAITALMTGN